jgi:hypothetical protein
MIEVILFKVLKLFCNFLRTAENHTRQLNTLEKQHHCPMYRLKIMCMKLEGKSHTVTGHQEQIKRLHLNTLKPAVKNFQKKFFFH